MHIYIGNLTIIGLDNGMSPGRRQAIIWTNVGILFIGPWGTNFNEILIGIHTFSFKKIHLKMSSAKWRPFCLGFNVLSRTAHHPRTAPLAAHGIQPLKQYSGPTGSIITILEWHGLSLRFHLYYLLCFFWLFDHNFSCTHEGAPLVETSTADKIWRPIGISCTLYT